MSPLALFCFVLVVASLELALAGMARLLGRRLRWEAHVGAILLPLALLLPWLASERVLAPCDLLVDKIPGGPQGIEANRTHDLLNDTIYQMLPWEMEVRRAFAEGRLPLWSDVLGGGSSPWINLQAAVLSPLANLARPFPIESYLLLGLFFKMQVAFVGTWLLARTVGLRSLPAVLAGASLALGGGVQSFGLYPNTYVLVWVPWASAATVQLFRSHGTPRPGLQVVAALTWTFVLLSGHPEVSALGCCLALALGLYFRRRRSPLRSRLVVFARVAAIAGGLAAVQWIPFLLALPHTARGARVLASSVNVHIGRPLWSSLLPFVPSGILHPHPFGVPFVDPAPEVTNWAEIGVGYSGILGLAGALATLATGRRRRVAPFLVVAMLSGAVAARLVAVSLPLYLVPPLRVFLSQRPLFLVAVSLALCAGFGAETILRSPRRKTVALLVTLAAAVTLQVGFEWRLVLLFALAILALPLQAVNRRHTASAVLLAVLLLDLLPWAARRLPEGHRELFYPETRGMRLIARQVERPGGPWRATGAGYTLYPGILAAYGVADVRPHDPLARWRYVATLAATVEFGGEGRYFEPLRNVDHPFLDFLGVRIVVSNRPRTPNTLERIDRGGLRPFRFYLNPAALPRAFVPIAAVPVADTELQDWLQQLDDARRVAVPEDATPIPSRPWSADAVQIVAASPGRLSLRLRPSAKEELVATSLPDPGGWIARAPGAPFATLTVNGAFLGVRVPPGVGELELRYRPRGFVLGAALAALALLGLGALVAQSLIGGRSCSSSSVRGSRSRPTSSTPAAS